MRINKFFDSDFIEIAKIYSKIETIERKMQNMDERLKNLAMQPIVKAKSKFAHFFQKHRDFLHDKNR